MPVIRLAIIGTVGIISHGRSRFQAPGVIAGGPTEKIQGNRRMSGMRSRVANDSAKGLLLPYCIERASTMCKAAYGIRTVVEIC